MERVEVLEHCQCRWRPAEVIIGVSLTRVSRIPWVSLWFCTGDVFFGSEQNLVHKNFSPISNQRGSEQAREPNDKKHENYGTCTIRPKRWSRVFLHGLKFTVKKCLHSEFFYFPLFSTWILWEMFGAFFFILDCHSKKTQYHWLFFPKESGSKSRHFCLTAWPHSGLASAWMAENCLLLRDGKDLEMFIDTKKEVPLKNGHKQSMDSEHQ